MWRYYITPSDFTLTFTFHQTPKHNERINNNIYNEGPRLNLLPTHLQHYSNKGYPHHALHPATRSI